MHDSRLVSGSHHSPKEWRKELGISGMAFFPQVGLRTPAPRFMLHTEPHQQRHCNSKLKHKSNRTATQHVTGLARPLDSRSVQFPCDGAPDDPNLPRPSRFLRPRWLPAAGRDGRVGSAGAVKKTREARVSPLMSAPPHTSVMDCGGAARGTELRAETGKDPFTTPIPKSYETAKIMEQSAAGVGTRAAARGSGVQRGVVPREGVETRLDSSQSSAATAGRSLTNKLRRLGKAGQWKDALNTLRDAQEFYDQSARGMGTGGVARVGCVAYNATLAALSRRGRWQEALGLLDEMQEKGIERDTVSFSSAIAACGRGNQWRKALDLLAEMREEAVEVNSIVYCNAIAACSKGKQWEEAVRLLGEMTALDGLAPNVQCYNAAMDACAKVGEQSKALSLLTEMRRIGLQRSGVSYLTAISACSRVGDWERALSLLDEMRTDGIEPDLKCYSAAISACGHGMQWNEAVSLLTDMRARGIIPNEFCYNAAISACGKSSRWKHAIELMKEMESGKLGVWPDMITYNAVIDACGKSGRWRESLEILQDMRARADEPSVRGSDAPPPPIPDATTYGTAITACSKGKQWKIALMLLEDMQAQGVAPTADVFQAAIVGCASAGQWWECLATLENMRLSGVRPKLTSYNSCITACGRGQQWQLALKVLQQMPSRGVTPDIISYNAALAACGQAGQWQLARRLLESMRNPTQPVPDAHVTESRAGQSLSDSAPGVLQQSGEVAGQAVAAAVRDERSGRTVARPRPRPRPDGVSFHVVLKALVNASQWDDAMEVLEELYVERQGALNERNGDNCDCSGVRQPLTLDTTRYRGVFTDFRGTLRDDELLRFNALKMLAGNILDAIDREDNVPSTNQPTDSR